MADFDADLQALTDAVGKTSDETAKRILDILRESQKKLAGELATTEWGAHHLEEMKKATADLMNEFSARVSDDFGKVYAEVWEDVPALIDGAMAAAGVPMDMMAAAPALSASQAEIMAGYSADLITNLAADAVKKINTALTMGVLGGKTLNEVMAEIGKNLTDSSVFGSIATRAETIARTELGRVFSAAREGRMKGIMEIMDARFPHVKVYKMWLHSGKPKKNARPRHRALDRQIVPADEDFPGKIPYPHAPGLPASEVVNCGCTHVLLFPGMKGYPDDVPKTIYDGAIQGTG